VESREEGEVGRNRESRGGGISAAKVIKQSVPSRGQSVLRNIVTTSEGGLMDYRSSDKAPCKFRG